MSTKLEKSWAQIKTDPNMLRDKIRELAEEYFHMYAPKIQPLFPWVLVYVLPKEQKPYGTIILSDVGGQGKQNKVILEGIVIRTWGSEKTVQSKDNEGKDISWVLKSELAAGDHVLFPHWAGWPPDMRLKGEFRLIKEFKNEASAVFGSEGDCIFAKMEPSLNIRDSLLDLFNEFSNLPVGLLLDKIQENYVVYPRSAGSITMSGE